MKKRIVKELLDAGWSKDKKIVIENFIKNFNDLNYDVVLYSDKTVLLKSNTRTLSSISHTTHIENLAVCWIMLQE